MASDGSNHHRSDSHHEASRGPPIPLQDLPATSDSADGRRRSWWRGSGSHHARWRDSVSSHHAPRGSLGGRYERVADDSPNRSETAARASSGGGREGEGEPGGFHTVDLGEPQPSHTRWRDDVDLDSPGSELAHATIGLSFDPPPPSRQSTHSRLSEQSRTGVSTMTASSEDVATFGHMGYQESSEDNNSFPVEMPANDRTPLTDRRYLQPISGAAAPQGQDHDRHSRHGPSRSLSVRFSESRPPTMLHLGDDLPHLEEGFGGGSNDSNDDNDDHPRSSRSRAGSTSNNALSRAGSMMRMVSQRVVNLTNEPELVEQSIRRKSSVRHARMEGPPALPAMPEYAHDANGKDEDDGDVSRRSSRKQSRQTRQDVLRGNSLGIFSPENKLRKALCEILVHPITEPTIFFLIMVQAVLLAIESSAVEESSSGGFQWGTPAFDYAFLGIFIVYTLELSARIIVSGLILNPTEFSTLDRSEGLKNAVMAKARQLFIPDDEQSSSRKSAKPANPQVSILRSLTGFQQEPDPAGNSATQQRIRLARRAFLRHSFNRLDFLAVVSYWISFLLSVSNVESNQHFHVFRMLSCLRILRLLALTNGTSVILRSLKKAAPLLVNVAFFIGFFWLLFAIIGLQSFKSSLRRTCVWVDPEGASNFTLNDAPDAFQLCGGHLDNDTHAEMPWIYPDGRDGAISPKGYICPAGSLCIEGSNPFEGTISFDNLVQSLELVFIIMSSNTFTDILYYTTDSDYLTASLFFIVGFVVLSLWLVNLLIAVITSSFQVIREESKRSAFAAQNIDNVEEENDTPRKVSMLKRLYNKTEHVWNIVIAFGLVVQCMRSSSMSSHRQSFINTTELVVTMILAFEICLRIAADWRNFHKSTRNWVDLFLAVVTVIIQIPPIRNSGQPYAAMTIFQVLRIYRLVLAFSLTRELIMTVFRNIGGLVNLIIFVALITFLTCLFAIQLFRDQIPREEDGEVTRVGFFSVWNSFLGMYQILSSENWTSILYTATETGNQWNTAWISATFFIMWFILANFIILNMFIAVIQESFDVSEDEKRLHQVKAFLQQKQVGAPSQGNIALSSIFRLGRDQRYKDPLDHGPAAVEMLMKDAVIADFLDEPTTQLRTTESNTSPDGATAQPGIFKRTLSKLKGRILDREPNPFYSKLKISKDPDDLDPSAMAKEVLSATEQRKRAQRQYLQRYPKYNVSLFLFPPSHPVRRFCQRIVGPGRGNVRIEGVDPIKPVWFAFSAFIYAAIVTMVVLACVATPLYQRKYFQQGGVGLNDWFVWTDLGFSILFSVEAVIKVIADGFFWTPNAYFRSSWGFIDGVVLITLWINVIAAMSQDGDISRIIGAFKALRALRLLNVSDSARRTFHAVIIMGGWKVISAAFVSMSFLVPFAIYGLNLFNDQMKQCNDDNFQYSLLEHCVGEYKSSPYAWDMLAPRTVENPFYSFDNFGSSLFILFQIVSQEGWTDVLWSAMSVTGAGRQPEPFASQANSLFFVVFNLLGAVFVLTLFVSVFMRNYTEQTGVAFLTAEQRSWLELRKLLRQINPSKRSLKQDTNKIKVWCYRIAVKKHGRWARFITSLLLLHLVLLVVEFYPEVHWWVMLRDVVFFVLSFFYAANVLIRLIGLTWSRFRRSSWDLYSVLAVSGMFVTTLLAVIGERNLALERIHKLFLVSITLLIIPRNNQLDQLFKTAAASFTAIANLLATWFVLFLVYAIALNQTFGLTKFGGEESANMNFRTVPKALILLFKMSCGEGWNEIMEDFATMEPPFCTDAESFFESDCGSAPWARTLFISWNIVSMYIFVSLFVSLIFESFSYVYQRSSGLYAISREEIRRFKQAWAMFDPDGTGFISKEAFPRLLGELSGVFEMRVYDSEHTVGSILEECKVKSHESMMTNAGTGYGVDLHKLANRLRNLPVREIRKRRERLNIFYEEVKVSAHPERGISFTSCLMILAHHKIITDNKSLRLEEYLRRRTRLQRVEEAVHRNVVTGFFDTLYWSRRFRRRIDAKRYSNMVTVPQFSVPEIFVENSIEEVPEDDDSGSQQDNESTPGPATPTQSSPRSERSTPRLPQIDTQDAQHDATRSSPTRTEWSNLSPSLSPHRQSPSTNLYDSAEGSDETPDQDGFQPHNNSVDVQDVIESLDNTAWGDSIRRSFTLRRSGTRRSGHTSNR